MGRHVGLTGTPGTGKKSVAPLVASLLGLPSCSINDLAATQRTRDEVDTEDVRAAISAKVTSPSLLYGHLLPYVVDRKRLAKVVVLRCEPSRLKQRLQARGYPPDKVASNVEAELIGVIAFDAFSKFGRRHTSEVDTTDTTPEDAAEITARLLFGQEPSPRRIDWTLTYGSASSLSSLLGGMPGGTPLT